MKRKQRPPEDTGTWMNTYSDLVTLLLCFFIMLYSMSTVDSEKWQQFVKAFVNPGEDTAQVVLETSPEQGDHLVPQAGFGGMGADASGTIDIENPLPADFNELYEYLKMYTAQNNMQGSVELQKSDDIIYIRFQNNIFFGADSSTLLRGSLPTLEFMGKCFKNVESEIQMIGISGHTASVENPKNYKVSDWILSGERAGRIAIFFEEQQGIDPLKLRPIGYGKNFPIAPNDTPENREKNRRVEMTVIGENSKYSQEELNNQLFGMFDSGNYPEEGNALDLLIPEASQP